MKKKPYQAISALYNKRALPLSDLVLISPLPPEETIRAIDDLARKGYVKKYHGDQVVAITDQGLSAGRKKIMSALQ